MAEALQKMIQELDNVQLHLQRHPCLSRPLRITKEVLESIQDAVASPEKIVISKTQSRNCLGEAGGLCRNIKLRNDSTDQSTRDTDEQVLCQELGQLMNEVKKLARPAMHILDVLESIERLDETKGAFGGTSNQFIQRGGSQNNNTGLGKQVNNNSTGEHANLYTGDNQSFGKAPEK